MKKHIVLKNQDADIYCFLNTISNGERKEIVSRILSSALRGRVLTLPMDFIIKAEDADLRGWMVALPHRTLNKTVNEILMKESKGEIAAIPFEFSSIESNKPLSCVIRIADEKVARFVSDLPKGAVMESVKKIIRKHICKNREVPPAEVSIPAELLAVKIEEFRQLLTMNADFYVGEHDKNRKIKSIYSKLINEILNDFIDCYVSDDEEKGDSILQNFSSLF